jgi:hypothetical protein
VDNHREAPGRFQGHSAQRRDAAWSDDFAKSDGPEDCDGNEVLPMILETTMIYLHVACPPEKRIASPLDALENGR